MADRLSQQFAFLQEADRLKSVLRAGRLCDGSRFENSAEHSWHLTLYALVLADQAPPDANLARAIKMLILHDLVEIDAGDVPIHAQGGAAHGSHEQQAAEQAAADRIFGLLPPDQAAEFRDIWNEFEANDTPDAIFAKSLDRVQPVMQNIANGGGSWIDYGVTLPQLDDRVGVKVARGLPSVWTWLRQRVVPFFA